MGFGGRGMGGRERAALLLGHVPLTSLPVPLLGSHGEHSLACVLDRQAGRDGHRPSWLLCMLKPISDVAKMLK